jgi:hypothetical protein
MDKKTGSEMNNPGIRNTGTFCDENIIVNVAANVLPPPSDVERGNP